MRTERARPRRWPRALVLALAAAAATAAAGPLAPARAQRAQAEDESTTLVDAGRAALRRRDYAAAGRALDEALRLNPRRLGAYVLRAAVHAALGEYDRGVALMRRAYALAPQDTAVITSLGSQLVLAGRADEGVALLEQALARDDARYDAHLLVARHHYRAGRWADAVPHYRGYLQHRPRELAGDDPRYQVELGDALLRDRRPEEAVPLLRAARKARPRDLRPRLGEAWAFAALDCRAARDLLAPLLTDNAAPPDVFLVDGLCALALRDPTTALARGRRYLQEAEHASAAGHALVGDAEAARGNLGAARAALAEARRLEPTTRRWGVRLAAVLRRAGQLDAARRELTQLGAPTTPAADPRWWIEQAEVLLASDRFDQVITELTPVVSALPNEVALAGVLGEALARRERFADATLVLEAAEARRSTARGRRWLAFVLGRVGVDLLIRGDAAAAEPGLARAAGLDPGPAALRNLGICLLELGRAEDAAEVLARASTGATSAAGPTWMLLGRARHLAGDRAGARAAYDRAASLSRGDAAVEVALDAAAMELDRGDPAAAVAALERASAAARATTPVLQRRHRDALASARHQAGVAAIRAGAAPRAVTLLTAALADRSDADALAVRCDLALAEVAAGDRDGALRRLRAVAGKTCPFPSPADTQAVPALTAFIDGLQAGKAGRVLPRLIGLERGATGPMRALLGSAIRVTAMSAAEDAYRAGQPGKARAQLAQARAAGGGRAGSDEVADALAYDLAVLDLAEGRVGAAIAALDKLTARLPEAWIALGVAHERQGDADRALDAWRRARKAGVRFAPLAEWIAAKERIYGGEP